MDETTLWQVPTLPCRAESGETAATMREFQVRYLQPMVASVWAASEDDAEARFVRGDRSNATAAGRPEVQMVTLHTTGAGDIGAGGL